MNFKEWAEINKELDQPPTSEKEYQGIFNRYLDYLEEENLFTSDFEELSAESDMIVLIFEDYLSFAESEIFSVWVMSRIREWYLEQEDDGVDGERKSDD